jgi:hypothetical protein
MLMMLDMDIPPSCIMMFINGNEDENKNIKKKQKVDDEELIEYSLCLYHPITPPLKNLLLLSPSMSSPSSQLTSSTTPPTLINSVFNKKEERKNFQSSKNEDISKDLSYINTPRALSPTTENKKKRIGKKDKKSNKNGLKSEQEKENEQDNKAVNFTSSLLPSSLDNLPSVPTYTDCSYLVNVLHFMLIDRKECYKYDNSGNVNNNYNTPSNRVIGNTVSGSVDNNISSNNNNNNGTHVLSLLSALSLLRLVPFIFKDDLMKSKQNLNLDKFMKIISILYSSLKVILNEFSDELIINDILYEFYYYNGIAYITPILSLIPSTLLLFSYPDGFLSFSSSSNFKSFLTYFYHYFKIIHTLILILLFLSKPGLRYTNTTCSNSPSLSLSPSTIVSSSSPSLTKPKIHFPFIFPTSPYYSISTQSNLMTRPNLVSYHNAFSSSSFFIQNNEKYSMISSWFFSYWINFLINLFDLGNVMSRLRSQLRDPFLLKNKSPTSSSSSPSPFPFIVSPFSPHFSSYSSNQKCTYKSNMNDNECDLFSILCDVINFACIITERLTRDTKIKSILSPKVLKTMISFFENRIEYEENILKQYTNNGLMKESIYLLFISEHTSLIYIQQQHHTLLLENMKGIIRNICK